MALTLVSFTIRDADGDKDTVAIYIPTGSLDIADFQGFVNTVAPLVDNISDGVVESAHITVGASLPGGLATDPVAGCEVEKGGLFQLAANGTNYTHSVRVPALTPSKFSGDAINLVDGDIAAFTAILTNGTTPNASLVSPSNKYEMDLTSVKSGVKSFRK